MPLRQPPSTAGTHPELPVRLFSQRMAYTSVREANSLRKNRTLSAAGDDAVTGPGWSRNSPVWVARGGRACSAVSSRSLRNRAFSARSGQLSLETRQARGRQPLKKRGLAAVFLLQRGDPPVELRVGGHLLKVSQQRDRDVVADRLLLRDPRRDSAPRPLALGSELVQLPASRLRGEARVLRGCLLPSLLLRALAGIASGAGRVDELASVRSVLSSVAGVPIRRSVVARRCGSSPRSSPMRTMRQTPS